MEQTEPTQDLADIDKVMAVLAELDEKITATQDEMMEDLKIIKKLADIIGKINSDEG